VLEVVIVLFLAHVASACSSIGAFDMRGELKAHVGDVTVPQPVVGVGLDGEYDSVGAGAQSIELLLHAFEHAGGELEHVHVDDHHLMAVLVS
jgi:hypothetical protein